MSSSSVQAKVVVLGKYSVGKTCLVDRLMNDRFEPKQVATIGAAYAAKTITANGKSVTLGIWDTAGSERYESMTKHYYKDASAAVVCFDLTDASSFEKTKFWVEELRKAEDNVSIVLAGTKADLIEDGGNREVPADQIERYAKSLDAPYFETSAKKNKNIIEVFQKIAATWLAKPKQVKIEDAISISKKNYVPESDKKGCC